MIGEGLRVLMLGPDISSGGAGTHFRNLVLGIAEIDPVVVILRESQSDLAFANHVSYISLGIRHFYEYPRAVIILGRICQRENCKVIFAFGPYPIILADWFLRFSGLKVKVIACEINVPSKSMSNPAYKGRWLSKLKNALLVRAYRRANAVVANSTEAVFELKETFRVAAKRVRRVPNIIDSERLKAVGAIQHDTAGGVFTVATTSRLEPQKRIADVIDACASLPDDVSWTLNVFGDGSCRSALEALAVDLGVAERVSFLGWVSEPAAALQGAGALVLASEYEGFSNSILEAMLLSVPCIHSRSTMDAREMESAGVVVGYDVGDVEGLRDALLRLERDRYFGRDLTANALLFASSHTRVPAGSFYIQMITAVMSGGELPFHNPTSTEDRRQ